MTTHTLLGSITGNDPSGYTRFAGFLGTKPALAHIYFNQTSAANLQSSISYECEQGVKFMAAGAQVLWSVPCPGARQLEAIVAGTYDAMYRHLFQSILAAEPAGERAVLVRLPWEFNLQWQENAAMDWQGKWNAALFVKAWQHIATITKSASPRFVRIWCPNVCTQGLDPLTCWPGLDYVECIAQDFYLQKAYDKPGFFNAWFRTEARGLQWGADFAHLKGLPYGLSEWGMDDDKFSADLTATANWLKAIEAAQASNSWWQSRGGAVHHHCWWDRPEVIDCRISDGTHPGLAAAYKAAFG